MQAQIIQVNADLAFGKLGKLPPHLIPAEVVPEPPIEVKVYLKPVRP